MATLTALILAGGSGTRFWPLSRRARPKQLLSLVDQRSLLRHTFERLAGAVPAERVFVCTTRELADATRAELPELAVDQFLVEPVGRNTAAAIGWAVGSLPNELRLAVVAVLPADHWVTDPAAFRAALDLAAHEASRRAVVMTLGVRPRWAHTGMGYLELAQAPTALAAYRVLRFTEKPDRAVAERLVAGGRHLWNGGIFLFRGHLIERLIAAHQPVLAAGIEAVIGTRDPAAREQLYAALPAVSIDTGVMERAEEIATVPLDCGWSDLGSYEALFDLVPSDPAGNRVRGAAGVLVDSRDNLVISGTLPVALLGVENLAVIFAGDSLLVMPRERAQDVRRIVDQLGPAGLAHLL